MFVPNMSCGVAFCFKACVGCLSACCLRVMEVELLELHADADATLVTAWEEKNFQRVSELLEKERCFFHRWWGGEVGFCVKYCAGLMLEGDFWG